MKERKIKDKYKCDIRKCDMKPGYLELDKRIIWRKLKKRDKKRLNKKVKLGLVNPLLIEK